MYITASNARRLQVGFFKFVSQWHAQLYTFYANTRVLIPAMTFYDAKPQSVKTPVAAMLNKNTLGVKNARQRRSSIACE